jgi:uncharacterized membrane-anchored protein
MSLDRAVETLTPGLRRMANKAFRFRVLGAVFAFWAAYVLTRPLGASLGDWLSQDRDAGGLGLGTVGPSVVFLMAVVGLVIYLTGSRRDVIR